MKFPEWRAAIEKEIRTIEKNETWEPVEKPPHKKAIGVKWIYKIKFNPDGNVLKYNVKGYSQQFGIDYNETFAPKT